MDIKQKTGSDSMMERLRDVAEPLCRAENFELIHLEIVSCNREKVIRFFMDKLIVQDVEEQAIKTDEYGTDRSINKKTGGITLDDCVYLSRQLGDLIDIYIEDVGHYRLEVSSPGPNRPLKKKEDFDRFKGERVKIETSQLVENKKEFTGSLETVNDDSVVIAVDGKQIDIRYREISKAMLAPVNGA